MRFANTIDRPEVRTRPGHGSKHLVLFVCAIALCGCATKGGNTSSKTADIAAISDNVTKIGDNQYKLGGQGSATDVSGTATKVKFMQQATAYCASQGLAMAPGKSTTKAPSADTRASAEIQFRCVPRQ